MSLHDRFNFEQSQKCINTYLSLVFLIVTMTSPLRKVCWPLDARAEKELSGYKGSMTQLWQS